MRKLRSEELRLLQSFPPEIELLNGRKCGGWLLPKDRPQGMSRKTIRNAYELGLIRVAGSDLIEHYPLELTELGKRILAWEKSKQT